MIGGLFPKETSDEMENEFKDLVALSNEWLARARFGDKIILSAET
jgi:hypothetical protein